VRFAWIKEHAREFRVTLMCDALNVSVSGYYAALGRKPSRRQQRREELVAQIRAAHEESNQIYGSPRIYIELKEQGVDVCLNTVAKYMRQEGLRVTPRRRFLPQTTDSDHPYPIVGNELDQDFTASAPNQKWACDLTYIWTDEGWLYLSVVIDLFSRRVVGWSMSDHLRAEGVAEALQMALQRRRPPPDGSLLHHSDRGVQYACQRYRSLLQEHGIACSMSRRGNCYDNAVVESFFGTIKTERVHRERYRTRAEARSSVFEWIECWYNRRRRHSSLGYLSPETYEAQFN
jgi:putative transposase